MVHVSSTMWRTKNRPSDSTSCSDNALRLLVLVTSKLYWGLHQVTSSISIWGCVLKGCVLREVHFEGPIRVWRPLKTSILNIGDVMTKLYWQCPTLAGSCGGQIWPRTSSDVFNFDMGLRFEGLCFERGIMKGQFAFEGHWRLQAWTMSGSQA